MNFFENEFIRSIITEAAKHRHIVVDGFCGLGGVTEGFFKARGYYVIACINHWDKAIECHSTNHPKCLHLTEDFENADLQLIAYMIREIKKINPFIQVHGWFSLECTDHSLAKGGMTRNPDSRTLADHMDRYAIELGLDIIWIENVKEFLLWGPLIPKTIIIDKGKKKPIFFSKSRHNADEFFAPYINANVYPQCPLVINKKEKTVEYWLIPDPEKKGEYFNRWKLHIESLGYQSEHKLLNCADYGVPQHRIRLFMQYTRKGKKAAWPVPTHDKKGRKGLPLWIPVRGCLDLEDEGESALIVKLNKQGKYIPRIKSIKTVDRYINGIIKHALNGDDSFLTMYYSNGIVDSPLDRVSPAIPTKDRLTLVKLHYLDKQYNGKTQHQSINNPSGVLTSVPKLNPVTIQLIDDTQYSNKPHGLDETAHTQVANNKHYYIISAHFKNLGKSIDQEAATVIARMDKKPPYLIITEFGELAIEVYDYDPPHIVKLKKFMAFYGIVSINVRMLNKQELKRIMTIPEWYELVGTEADKKKMIGNAVPPMMVTALAEAHDTQIPELFTIAA